MTVFKLLFYICNSKVLYGYNKISNNFVINRIVEI